MSLPSYAVDFRGFPACPCQAEWLPAYEHELQRRGIILGSLIIDQLIGGFEASGGTHIDGGVSDFGLTGRAADAATAIAREMGADATWHRLPNWDGRGGVEHVHSALRNDQHLSPAARDQYVAVDNGGDGLVGDRPDPGPRPLSGRTWREGIAWAQQQEDEDMLSQEAKDAFRAIVREEIDATEVPNPSDPKGDPWKLRRLLIDTWKRAGK